MDTDIETWSHVFRVNFFAPIMMARGLIEELKHAKGCGGERHLDRGLARAPVRRRRLCDLEGGTCFTDPRNGVRFRPRRRPRQLDRAGRDRHPILSPGTEKIVEQQIPMHRLGTPDEVAKIIYVLCTETSSRT